MDQSTFIQRRRYKVASFGQQGSDASNRYLDRNGSYHTATVAGRALDDTNGYCCSPPTVPEPLLDLSAVLISGPAARLTFTPGFDGKSPITNYLISYDGITYVPFEPPVTEPPIVLDVSLGTTYTFYLKSVNDVGVSEPSSVTLIIPNLPAAPTNLVGTPGLTSISIAFTPGNDGGSDILNYWYSLNGGALVALSPVDDATPVTIPGLSSGTNYTIRLAAQNAMGVGAQSDPITVTTTVPASTPPTLLLAVADDASAYVYFTEGTGTITNYEWSTDGTIFTAFDPAITTSPVQVPGLNNDEEVTIYLRSVLAGGSTSAASNPLTVFPTATPSSVGPTLLYDAATYSGGSAPVPNSAPGGAVVSGTLSNVSYNSGIAGGVFDFPGSGYINFGTYDFGNLITVCAWVYPRTKASLNGLISTRFSGGGGNSGFTFGWNNYGSTDRALCTEMANGPPNNQMFKPSTIGGIIIYSPPAWQHVAYVYSKITNTLIMYKNGIAQTVPQILPPDTDPSKIACPANVRTSGEFKIGALEDNSFGMNAQLGYIKVFGDTLNATDIYNDYNTTKSRFGL
jgi:hypothetical protein